MFTAMQSENWLLLGINVTHANEKRGDGQEVKIDALEI